MLVHTVSDRIATRLAGYAGCQDKTAVLAYGLELIIGESFKLGLLFALSSIFGLLNPTLLFLSTAIPFRLISGGGHCSTYFRCVVLTIAIYLMLPAIVFKIHPLLDIKFALAILPIVLVVALIAISLWIPAENPNRSFNEKEKARFKKLSLAFIIIWLLGSLLVYILIPGPAFKLYLASTLTGILWQIFLVSPIGYMFFAAVEKLFDLVSIPKEVR